MNGQDLYRVVGLPIDLTDVLQLQFGDDSTSMGKRFESRSSVDDSLCEHPREVVRVTSNVDTDRFQVFEGL